MRSLGREEAATMRQRRIREEKPKPKRRRRHVDGEGPGAPRVATPSVAHGRELLSRLHAERATIEEALALLTSDPRG
jgi:hypothetical protein